MKIIRKGTTPNGTHIQIEDWSENYTFYNKNATIGFYPMAIHDIYDEENTHFPPNSVKGMRMPPIPANKSTKVNFGLAES